MENCYIMKDIEITTMCAIVKNDQVLMISRKNSWIGWAFPGGHIENNESIYDCIKREIKEETGLDLKNIQFRGFADFYNPETKKRHIVNNFYCEDFCGNAKKSCNEGKLQWFHINELLDLNLAEGMKYRLPLFFEDALQELYIEWTDNKGYIKVKYQYL